jgi:hypothetical protein
MRGHAAHWRAAWHRDQKLSGEGNAGTDVGEIAALEFE